MDYIKNCTLFSGLSDADYLYATEFFSCRRRFFEKNEVIKKPGGLLNMFGLLLSGGIQVSMYDIDGQQMILANVVPGETFGESLCFLGLESAVSIQASSPSSILFMSTDRLHFSGGVQDSRDAVLSNRFTAMLAARALSMNDRIQVLSKLTIREKLITYFSQCAQRADSHMFTVPFDRATMAKYLGVDRSALSRELSKMRREGLIDFEKSQFSVKSIEAGID